MYVEVRSTLTAYSRYSPPDFLSHARWLPFKLLAGKDDATGAKKLGYSQWRAFHLSEIYYSGHKTYDERLRDRTSRK